MPRARAVQGLLLACARIVGLVAAENPHALRASDADRENVLDVLKRHSAEGRLSQDTLLHRTELALRARRTRELADLVHDLPVPAPPPRRALRVLRWWSDFSARAQLIRRTSQLPRLVLPRADRVFVIGRSPDCDLVLSDATVSWRHAELRPTAGVWALVDLDSTNGTHINGWRVGSGFTVRDGDWVQFGHAGFRITA